jgi:hypothetical protein
MHALTIVQRFTRWNAALLFVALIGGCSSLQPCGDGDLRDPSALACVVRGLEARPPADQSGCLIGNVAAAVEESIVIVAYRQRHDAVEVVASSTLTRPGPYSLAVPPGTYRLAAFHDADGDRRYDPVKEAATVYHDGGAVVVMPRKRVDRLFLTLHNDAAADGDVRSLQRLTLQPTDQSTAACATS